jgi:hypothetical protein
MRVRAPSCAAGARPGFTATVAPETLKAGIRTWMALHMHHRPDSALGGRRPAVIYWLGNATPDLAPQVQ